MTDFGVIIPARFASSRLPGKPLRDLAGKPMIVRAWQNALKTGAAFVLVATDDLRIARVVEAAGGEAILTSPDHASGTDRLAEVVCRRGIADETIVVNVQGDEPLLDASLVRRVADALAQRPRAGISTLATPIRDATDLFDPNVVKVVVDSAGMALMFSRAPVPWVRDLFNAKAPCSKLPPDADFLRHIGLYAYTVGTLKRIGATPPVALEKAECLEQLRALWLEIGIHVTVAQEPPARGVDTEADLRRAAEVLRCSAREGQLAAQADGKPQSRTRL
jgi:3-deoxy-manno-octulosonate cytidylyltransferase (CMP-KDO synthetase)